MSLQHQRVASIGLGAMGAALAKALLAGGAEVRAWNRTAGKTAALGAAGAIVCSSAREAIAGSEFVVVCVSDYTAWKALVDAEQLGRVLTGRTILQLTTGTAVEARAHEDWARQCNARVLDGAIMGFPSQIGTEQTTIVAAGARPVFDACGDILAALTPNVTYLEDNVAAPAILDMAVLSAMVGYLMGIASGAALCAAGGVPLARFTELQRAGGNVALGEANRVCAAIESGNTRDTEASLATWAAVAPKLVSLAHMLGTNAELPAAQQRVFQAALDRDLGQHDIAALVHVLRKG